jgi:cytochrome c-type biogenesis protein CcmH
MSVSRREFFAVAAGAIGAVVQDTTSGRVFDPRWAGRSLPVITAADNDLAIQAIEKQLKCSCGCGLDIYTCRTTDFSCTYSPGLHQQVVALAQAGKTGQEILDAFVAEYGVAVLMAPPKRGFNLAGYFVPSIAVLVAAAFLIRTLRRWTRAGAADAAAAASAAARPDATGATPAELDRLRRELERIDA